MILELSLYLVKLLSILQLWKMIRELAKLIVPNIAPNMTNRGTGIKTRSSILRQLSDRPCLGRTKTKTRIWENEKLRLFPGKQSSSKQNTTGE